MKPLSTVPLAASLLLLGACTAPEINFGSEASGARTSGARSNASDARTLCELPAPTVTGPLYTGGTIPEQTPVSSTAALAVMVGYSPDDSASYSIELVDTNGQVVASIKAHLRSPITRTCGKETVSFPAMPWVSTTSGRAYYLDGDTDVRYLTPDGSTGLATRLPGSSQSIAIFAVSPDESKIAVSGFNFRWHPVLAHLYVQDVDGGNRVELPDSNTAYRWPAGWHDGNLVVTYGTTRHLDLLDPTTGRTLATIGGPTCQPLSSLPSPAGLACATSDLAVGRIDWSGDVTIFANGDAYTGGASLSPDGTQLLASGTGAVLRLIDSPQLGSTVTSLGSGYPQGGGYPGEGGWLDDFHAVYRVAGTPNQAVMDIRTHAVVSLPANTSLTGRLPGGF